MEQKLIWDDRLDVARRLYRALCAQYPDRFIAFRFGRRMCLSSQRSAGSARCRSSDSRCAHLRRYVTIRRAKVRRGVTALTGSQAAWRGPRSAVSHRGR